MKQKFGCSAGNEENASDVVVKSYSERSIRRDDAAMRKYRTSRASRRKKRAPSREKRPFSFNCP
ncbi:hypothetical protein HMPREF9555_01666 [Selenomonas artemidis F0399]|uniref:Uncharacterized protein n=1 Tax=Selenomonas artemidis F0399 TaxID=749551 RepID=E7N3S6_9FIRM|nr:hypothetical protein HMPREF9555_01666 [Selenomonas artemidis F0399]